MVYISIELIQDILVAFEIYLYIVFVVKPSLHASWSFPLVHKMDINEGQW